MRITMNGAVALSVSASLWSCIELLATPIHAQSGWTLYWENDAFVFGDGSDRAYTNGVRFSHGIDPNNNPRQVDSFGEWWQRHSVLSRSQRRHTTTSAIIVGQNFFTPSEITTFVIDSTDRPYAGLLYGGLRVDVTEDAEERPVKFQTRFQHSFEMEVGLIGPAAGSEAVQTGVHALRQNRIPKGWHAQLPHEPALFGSYQVRSRFGWHFADAVPHVGVMLGHPQTYAYVGGVARLGWNMSGFPSLLIRPTAVPALDRADWELSFFMGYEGRSFARNAYIEGSLLRKWPGLEAEQIVSDEHWGFSVRITDWRVTYTEVSRSPELGGDSPFAGTSHRYGAIALAYEPGLRTPADRQGTVVGLIADKLFRAVLGELLFEASLGQGFAADVRDVGSASDDGVAMHLGVGRRFGKYLAISGEITGMVVEGPEPPVFSEDHTDVFIGNKLLSVRITPFGDGPGPGVLHLRGGIGEGSAKLQVTPGTPGDRQVPCTLGTTLSKSGRTCNSTETGLSFMAGSGYGLRITESASIDLNLSWHRFSLERARGFLMLGIGVGWHP